MKLTELPSAQSQRGNVLIMTVILGAIAGIMLAACVELIQTRSVYAKRSQAWNSAVPLLEAGIEEAFTHLKDDSANLSANGWTALSAGVYQKQRTFPDSSYFITTISNATTVPVIFSQGFVRSPLKTGEYISRLVCVTTLAPGVFAGAISANGLITLSGAAVVDGYNSSSGPYNPSNHLDSGGIATNYKGKPAIKVGTGHVYGRATTGAGGTVTSGSSGAVGDASWIDGGHTGFQPGSIDDDFNVAFPVQKAPDGPFAIPTTTSIGGSNIMYLSNDTYKLSSFTSSDSTKPMIVTGKATLYVDGKLTVSGSGYIQIAPGASLDLYCGDDTTISGGGVANKTGLPSNLSIHCLPPCGKLVYSGSAAFVGTINAPQTDFTISGSAGAYGACIVNTYTSSGGSGFHYDQALGGGSNYKLASYREL